MRDSLSVLDQLIAGSSDEGLTYERAAALLGFTDGELLDAVITGFAAGDAGSVYRHLHDVIETGLDPRRFVEDLLERLRDLIVVLAAPDGARAILRGLPEDQVERMRQQASAFGAASLTRAASIVNEGLTEMSGVTSPRLQLELIAARVLLPGAAGESGYAARIDRLERRMEVGGVPTAKGESAAPPASAPSQASPADQPVRSGAPAPSGGAPAEAARPQPQDDVPAASAGGRDDDAPPTAGGPSAGAPTTGSGPDSAPADDTGGGAPARAGALDVDAIRRAWPDILGRIYQRRRATWTFLSEHGQVLSYDGQRLVIGISTTGLANAFRSGSHADVVRQALIDALGVDVMVEGIPHVDEGTAAAPGPSSGAGRPPGAGSSDGSVPGGSGPAAASAPGPSAQAPARSTSLAGSPAQRPPVASSSGASSPGSDPSRSDGPGERPSWSSSAAAGGAPSWATEDPFANAGRSSSEPAGEDAQAPAAPAQAGPPGGAASTEPSPTAAVPSRDRGDALDAAGVSADDEDIVEAGEAGPAVVQRVLGGTVIREDEG